MSEPYDRYADELTSVVPTQCLCCTHLGTVPGPASTCTAFPGAIPAVILANRYDHRQPYIVDGEAADMGIALERSITFAPRADVPRAVLDRLYRTLDALHE